MFPARVGVGKHTTLSELETHLPKNTTHRNNPSSQDQPSKTMHTTRNQRVKTKLPHYLDQFAAQIRDKREKLRKHLGEETSKPFDLELEKTFLENWVNLETDLYNPRVNMAKHQEVVAVDGSRATIEFAGNTFYIVRALALAGKKRKRKLEADIALSKAETTEIDVFINQKMEKLEFDVAREMLTEENLGDCLLLLDCSLHGRMLHTPRDTPIFGERKLLLDYFESYTNLLEECKNRRVTPIGISKDSRVDYLKKHLLAEIYRKHADNAEERVIKVLQTLGDKTKTLRKLLEENNLDSTLFEVVGEALTHRTDQHMIRSFAETAGYTTRLELGATEKQAENLEKIVENPKKYLEEMLPESIMEAVEEESFVEQALETLKKIPEMPTTIFFHLLPDARDTPLRIDIPSWVFGLKNSIFNLRGFKPVEVDVTPLVNTLLEGYAGLKNYNIWLVKADQEVRISEKTVNTLYYSTLQKIVGQTPLRTRRSRRVKHRYP